MSRTATPAGNALRLVRTMEASEARPAPAASRTTVLVSHAAAARLEQLAGRSAVPDALCNPVPAPLSITQS